MNIPIASYELKIILILAIGFGLASCLGYLCQRIKLPAILGYLIAGYLIGPFSPGFVADLPLSEQLAELGVVLMMFGVGLHFKLKDLLDVKKIAITGALGQTFIAAIVCTFCLSLLGWPLKTNIIIGLAIGVASTVVLVRILTDNRLLETKQGHIAVGWLVVEDLITVLVLVLLPDIASSFTGESLSLMNIFGIFALAISKILLLTLIMFSIGQKIVSVILIAVARSKSQELFTLTILALTFVIALGSAYFFGASVALGAFISGMVIGQTIMRHQATAHALPMKDAFAVFFFLSVGMLFNPAAIVDHFATFLTISAIILIVKPLAAFLICLSLRLSKKIAVIIAMALAQIGEFSFILSEEALKLNLMPDEGFDIIVACAALSISLNPIIFKVLLGWLDQEKTTFSETLSKGELDLDLFHTIVIGYGTLGKACVETLKERGIKPVIIDSNIDLIKDLPTTKQKIVFGDAIQPTILESAAVQHAYLVIITVSNSHLTDIIVHHIHRENPKALILAYAQSAKESSSIEQLGVSTVCAEEESVKALRTKILQLVP